MAFNPHIPTKPHSAESPHGKENFDLSQTLVEQVMDKVECLSRLPLIGTRMKTIHSLTPWKGYHEFKAWIPEPKPSNSRSSGCGYQVGSVDGCPKVYVQRARRWPLTVAFRPSITPVHFCIRVTPHFADCNRSSDMVTRCLKHVGVVPNLQGQSVVEVVNPLAEYVVGSSLLGLPPNQITVVFPLDVIKLIHRSTQSSSTQPQASQSILLPEVECTFECRIHCFNSCHGVNLRGEVDLLITLEAQSSNESPPHYEILGLQKLRIRCCACPSRDSREPTSSSAIRPKRRSLGALSDLSPSLLNERPTPGWCPRKLSLSMTPSDFASANVPQHASETGDCEVVIDGKRYAVILTERDPFVEYQVRATRKFFSAQTAQNAGLKRSVRHVERKYRRLEQLVSDRLRNETLTCSSQESSCSSTSSKGIQTDFC